MKRSLQEKLMAKNNTPSNNQAITVAQTRFVDIPNALPMRLQLLDVARHTVVAPDGKRYVVATFNDTRLGRGYVTAVYPQQNEYLTLVRLTICEFSHPTAEEAMQQ